MLIGILFALGIYAMPLRHSHRPCSFSDNAEAECEACLQRALQIDSTHFDAHLQVAAPGASSRHCADRCNAAVPDLYVTCATLHT